MKNLPYQVLTLAKNKEPGSDAWHVICELANFLLDQQKVFDLSQEKMNELFENDLSEILQTYASLQKGNLIYMELEDRFYLIHKKHESLFQEYRKETGSAKGGQLYGDLMGFPATATEAYLLDWEHEVEERKFLMGFHANDLVTRSLGDIFLMPFIFSKNNWQDEYRAWVKIHLNIYQKFPETFSYLQTSRAKTYLREVKQKMVQESLWNLFGESEKQLFQTYEDPTVSWKKKHSIWKKKMLT
ncbi:MAG: hypothetical protein KBC98_01810 [Candidatus Pacebacteria bacterium]|jgi:hypothetical protein|nr:hypothetical protein [Candidatus Paceibacterota bacterium]